MYQITTVTKEEETIIARSQNKRLCKRKARAAATSDPDLWFSKFILYEDEKVIEEGNIINSRISWEKRAG